MKTLRLFTATIALCGITALPAMAADQNQPVAPSAAHKAEPPAAEKTTGETVRQKAGETVDAIKSYSIEKKDEAVNKAKEAMDDIDAREDRLEQRIKEKKAEWSKKMAKKKEEELSELRKAREELAARYQKLKEASKKSWEAAKHAFIRSYNKFMHKLDKVNSDTLASREDQHSGTPRKPSASR